MELRQSSDRPLSGKRGNCFLPLNFSSSENILSASDIFFLEKIQTLALKIFHFYSGHGEFNNKNDILNTRNLLCRNFAAE